MNRVHIVEGRTGEYSDFRDWVVEAFECLDDAQSRCDALNNWCKENNCNDDLLVSRISTKIRLLECPLDPHFQCEYTGTEYCIISLDVTAKTA